MSYDGPLWVPPEKEQSAGKKPAMVEDYVCEELPFIVVGERNALERLWECMIGRVAPFVKKSTLHFRYETAPDLIGLRSGEATADTLSLTALPMIELGSMPRHASPYLMPVKSRAEPNRSGKYEITWSHLNCVWESGLKLREDTPVLLTEDGDGVSRSLLDAILEE